MSQSDNVIMISGAPAGKFQISHVAGSGQKMESARAKKESI